MRSRRHRTWKSRASSLVITLLAITVLAIIVVAFVQAMTMARSNAKSYRDILQAHQSAEAGLDVALSQLILATGTNQAFVTGRTNFPDANFPLTVIGRENLTNAAQMMPLVSGPANLLQGFGTAGWSNFSAYAVVRTNGQPQSAADLNTAEHFIEVTSDTNQYRAAWVILTNIVGDTTNYSRFAYTVQDEQARLNPGVQTGQGTGMSNEADWYSGPQDISLTNAAEQLLTPDQAQAARQNAGAIALSQQGIAQVFAARTNYEVIKHLLTAQSNPTYDVIPQWLPDGGKSKYNLNDLATNTLYGATASDRVTNLTAIISRNLTNFSSRDPVLRGTNEALYLKRLAANIVDYIDADSLPTSIDNGGTPEPAGRDSLPLPVLIAERLNRTQCDPYHAPATTTIETQLFVQVWNPYTTPVTLKGTARFQLKNRPQLIFGDLTKAFDDYNESLALDQVVRPNEFVVLTFPSKSQVFQSSTALPVTPSNVDGNEAGWPHFNATPVGTVTNPTFSFFFQPTGGSEVLVDLSQVGADGIGGLDRDAIIFDTKLTASRNWYERNYLQMYPTPGREFVGDPRFACFTKRAWWSSISDGQYTTATWWKGRQNITDVRSEDFTANWINRDYVPRNPSVGNLAANNQVLPSDDTAVPSAYSPVLDGPAAISVMRNGPMKSIGELGHVFDPSYGDDNLSPANALTDPTSSGALEKVRSTYVSGGGRTLRIGQPEFTVNGANNWNTNGRRATELLDLFTVNPTNAQGVSALGRINPNTAPVEVLSAVLAGITVDSDEALPARTLAVTNLATAIITNRPYSSLSDLYKTLPNFANGTNYSPAFNQQIGGGTTNLATFDRVREEAFGKLIQHMTVQSRSYRVYAVGQTLDAKQNPRGTAVLEASVFLNFDKTSQQFRPVVQYRRFLQ